MLSGISLFMGTIHLPSLELSSCELCTAAATICIYRPPIRIYKVFSGHSESFALDKFWFI